MGLLDRINNVTLIEPTQMSEARLLELGSALEDAASTIASMEESLADLELSRDDVGWQQFGSWGRQQFTREGLRKSAELCRVMVLANPLMKRGVALRTAYVWAGGVQFTALATGPTDDNQAQQDVNTIVQGFLDEPETQRVLYSAQAFERNERTLATDGNFFVALIPNPVTGQVRPRTIPFDEIVKVISNPEDALERRFFLRQYVQVSNEDAASESTKTTVVKVLHPSIDYQPPLRPATLGGVPIKWDAPVAELSVNALDTWDFGVGDAFASLPWARGYSEFLTDGAKLMKALSRLAFKASADSKGKAQNAASKQKQIAEASTPGGLPRPNPIGGTVHVGPGQDLEAITKPNVDLGAGRPLASMTAAGLEVPVTMLLADPGVTGARATAETLDKPTEDMATMRRNVWGDFYRRILGFVIDQAAIAPQGKLSRVALSRDGNTGRQVVTLAGETDRTLEVAWPDLSETPVKDLVDAIVKADGTGKLPPLEIAKLLAHALQVEDVDALLDLLTDEDGNWVDPEMNAGTVAVAAFNNGEDPAEAIR